MSVMDLKNATLVISDGDGHSTTVKLGSGTLTWDETRAIIYDLDKGILDETRLDDETPLDLNMDFKWEYATSSVADSEPVTPYEALTKTGSAAVWLTSAIDTCAPYAVDLTFTYAPDCSTKTNDNETIVFPDFREEKISFDAKNGMIKATGKCNVTRATYARVQA